MRLAELVPLVENAGPQALLARYFLAREQSIESTLNLRPLGRVELARVEQPPQGFLVGTFRRTHSPPYYTVLPPSACRPRQGGSSERQNRCPRAGPFVAWSPGDKIPLSAQQSRLR